MQAAAWWGGWSADVWGRGLAHRLRRLVQVGVELALEAAGAPHDGDEVTLENLSFPARVEEPAF